tara:strand:+ start:3362 stop:4072 length:711 start_codon:yes stop_codon:yes gene_type:complete
MALTSSGAKSFAAFNAEFGLGYTLSSYYNCDPYLPVPRSGTISFSNFHSADNRTAELLCGKSEDGAQSTYGRAGWAEAKGSGFLTGAEASENRNAFGSTSKNLLMSTGQRIVGLYAADQSGGTAINRYVALTKKGSGNTSTTGGFTELRMRFNNKYWRYGDPTPAGQSAATDYEVSFTRASAAYGMIPNTYDSGGTATYFYRWITSSASGGDDASKAYLALHGAQYGGYISFKVIY